MRRAQRQLPRPAVYRGAVAAVAAVVLMAACTPEEPLGDESSGSDEPGDASADEGGWTAGEQRGPHDPDAEMNTEEMVAEPSEAQAGDIVKVHFPQQMMRGVHLVLEREIGGTWQHLYNINTNVHNESAPQVVRVGDDGWEGFEDIGINDASPDPVPLPADTPAGNYRICTGNAGENVCTPLTVLHRE